MKKIILIVFSLWSFASVEEVRRYWVSLDVLERVEPTDTGGVGISAETQQAVNNPFAPNRPVDDPSASGDGEGIDLDLKVLGPALEKPGFKSRFFKESGKIRDASKLVSHILGDDALKAEAVYDIEQECLIVKGNEEAHSVLQSAIEIEMSFLIRVTLGLHELPGVLRKDRTGFRVNTPKEAKLLNEVSWLATSGQRMPIRAAGGDLVIESEIQWDAYDGYVGQTLLLESQSLGGGFRYQTTVVGVTGVIWVQEVGSLDGQNTLMLSTHYDPVLPDGRRWDEWVEKDEGGFFLEEARLQRLRWTSPHGQVVPDDESDSIRKFRVPPTFLSFLSNHVEDPDQPQDGPKGRRTLKELLQAMGVEFREKDFVRYQRGSSEVFARLSAENLEILYGIIMPAGTGPPEYAYLEFTEVEGEDFEAGKVLRRMVMPLMYGADTTASLGKDLEFEGYFQTDSWNRSAELQVKLTESKRKRSEIGFQTSLVARFGKPVLVKSERVKGKQRIWFVVARNKVLEAELDRFLKSREGKE